MTELGAGIKVTPVAESMGAEVAGLSVRDIPRLGIFERVKRLLFDFQLLVFRDQQLTPEDLEGFTRLFGEPDPHVLQQYALTGHPDIFVISNLEEGGRPVGSRYEGFGWHTDLPYLDRPAAYTILYALEVPTTGGDTVFASLYRAYDELPEEEKERLRSLSATHSYLKLYNMRPNPPPLTPEQRARTPDVSHPLVRIHPETGREGLYINRDDVVGVDGLETEEALALIDRLFEFAQQPRFVYQHKWRAGDLTIWDNRGTIHRATPYDMERDRRLVYRTSVRGERPIPWTAGRTAKVGA